MASWEFSIYLARNLASRQLQKKEKSSKIKEDDFAYTAAHWPMHALAEDIAKYQGKYDSGYSPLRAARFARLRELGLINPAWELSPEAGDWGAVTNRAWYARCMEVYAAMVDRMDQGIGRIIAELKRQGRLDNTLVFFLQDNGGCAENMGRSPNADQVKIMTCKPMAPDDLQKCIWPPMQTGEGRPVRPGPGVMPGPEDTYAAYGRGGANVPNTPFREYNCTGFTKAWATWFTATVYRPAVYSFTAGFCAKCGKTVRSIAYAIPSPGEYSTRHAICGSMRRPTNITRWLARLI